MSVNLVRGAQVVDAQGRAMGELERVFAELNRRLDAGDEQIAALEARILKLESANG